MKNCFDGYLTNTCESCSFWKDGTTNEGIGCAYPGPIDHCRAFKKMREEEERKVLEPPEMTGEWIPVPPERSGEWVTIQTQGEAIISSAVSNISSRIDGVGRY